MINTSQFLCYSGITNVTFLYSSIPQSALAHAISGVIICAVVMGIGAIINAFKGDKNNDGDSKTIGENVSDAMIYEHLQEEKLPSTTKFSIAPEIKSKKSRIEKSFSKGKIRKIELEFVDGVIGHIFQDMNRNEYYFESKGDIGNTQCNFYKNYPSCVDSFYYFSKNKELLTIDLIRSAK